MNEIKAKLGFQERGLFDFLDCLVSMGFLDRSGIKESSVYSNSHRSDKYLVEGKEYYVGGMLVMADQRGFNSFCNLEHGLRTGKPQNETN